VDFLLLDIMEKCCVTCRFFKDAAYSKTYITPRCTQRGDDDCAYMRQNICGLSGSLYEARTDDRTNAHRADEHRDGEEHLL